MTPLTKECTQQNEDEERRYLKEKNTVPPLLVVRGPSVWTWQDTSWKSEFEMQTRGWVRRGFRDRWERSPLCWGVRACLFIQGEKWVCSETTPKATAVGGAGEVQRKKEGGADREEQASEL
jgi:hypothetical protein